MYDEQLTKKQKLYSDPNTIGAWWHCIPQIIFNRESKNVFTKPMKNKNKNIKTTIKLGTQHPPRSKPLVTSKKSLRRMPIGLKTPAHNGCWVSVLSLLGTICLLTMYTFLKKLPLRVLWHYNIIIHELQNN